MQGVVADAPYLRQRAGVLNRGRKLKDTLVHLTLNWAPRQQPDQAHVRWAMQSAFESLGSTSTSTTS